MISLLCPTRRRQHDAVRMATSALDTAVGGVEVLFYVDDDDENPTLHRPTVYNVRGPRNGVGKAWNVLAGHAGGDLLFLCNDDLRFDTDGWDEQVRYAMFDDGIGVVFANDGLKGATHCAFPFVTRKWVETLGYFTPEHFGFFYHDTWIFDLAQRIDRVVYLRKVHITHWHNMSDDTAREARQRSGNDHTIWNQTEPERVRDAALLTKAMT